MRYCGLRAELAPRTFRYLSPPCSPRRLVDAVLRSPLLIGSLLGGSRRGAGGGDDAMSLDDAGDVGQRLEVRVRIRQACVSICKWKGWRRQRGLGTVDVRKGRLRHAPTAVHRPTCLLQTACGQVLLADDQHEGGGSLQLGVSAAHGGTGAGTHHHDGGAEGAAGDEEADGEGHAAAEPPTEPPPGPVTDTIMTGLVGMQQRKAAIEQQVRGEGRRQERGVVARYLHWIVRCGPLRFSALSQ